MNPLNHVAIIMDGNGRWGVKNHNSRNQGHKEGLNTIVKIIDISIKKKIKYLTFYAFSTENWKRPISEINFLFSLLENFLTNKIDELNKKQINLKFIGKKKFTKKLVRLINQSEKKTKSNSKLYINIALNYGSRNEIVQTVNLLLKNKKLINEKNISLNLFTKKFPDPDILIRTGNTKRLSNFLLWQLSYTEIFFVKKLWPDFNKSDFNRIIQKYKLIQRNYGS